MTEHVQPGDAIHPGKPVTVDRYGPLARLNHWITAISLILLAVSGLALFWPSLFFLTNLFGGGQNTRAIHPWIGVVLFFSFFVKFKFSFFFLFREQQRCHNTCCEDSHNNQQ